MHTRKSPYPMLGRLLIASAVMLAFHTTHAEPSDKTTINHVAGKNRVHVDGCKRLTQDPAEKAKLAKMTLAEAKAKDLELCSKCPGSTTPGRDKSENEKPEKAAGDKNPTVFHAPGKNSVHAEGCRRLTKDPTELAKFAQMTLADAKTKGFELCSRCPGSSTPGKDSPEGGGGGPESWVNPAPDAIGKKSFIPSRLAPLVSLGNDGRLVYKPYSERGDRVLDWSHCGYKQSAVPIPHAPVVETLEPLPGEAIPGPNMAYPPT